MAFDYSMLKKRIREQFGNVTEFCQSCGINEAEFLKKMISKEGLGTDDMMKIGDVLNISANEVQKFFFTEL